MTDVQRELRSLAKARKVSSHKRQSIQIIRPLPEGEDGSIPDVLAFVERNSPRKNKAQTHRVSLPSRITPSPAPSARRLSQLTAAVPETRPDIIKSALRTSANAMRDGALARSSSFPNTARSPSIPVRSSPRTNPIRSSPYSAAPGRPISSRLIPMRRSSYSSSTSVPLELPMPITNTHRRQSRYFVAEHSLTRAAEKAQSEPTPEELKIRVLKEATSVLNVRAQEAQNHVDKLRALLAQRDAAEYHDNKRSRWMQQKREEVLREQLDQVSMFISTGIESLHCGRLDGVVEMERNTRDENLNKFLQNSKTCRQEKRHFLAPEYLTRKVVLRKVSPLQLDPHTTRRTLRWPSDRSPPHAVPQSTAAAPPIYEPISEERTPSSRGGVRVSGTSLEHLWDKENAPTDDVPQIPRVSHSPSSTFVATSGLSVDEALRLHSRSVERPQTGESATMGTLTTVTSRSSHDTPFLSEDEQPAESPKAGRATIFHTSTSILSQQDRAALLGDTIVPLPGYAKDLLDGFGLGDVPLSLELYPPKVQFPRTPTKRKTTSFAFSPTPKRRSRPFSQPPPPAASSSSPEVTMWNVLSPNATRPDPGHKRHRSFFGSEKPSSLLLLLSKPKAQKRPSERPMRDHMEGIPESPGPESVRSLPGTPTKKRGSVRSFLSSTSRRGSILVDPASAAVIPKTANEDLSRLTLEGDREVEGVYKEARTSAEPPRPPTRSPRLVKRFSREVFSSDRWKW